MAKKRKYFRVDWEVVDGNEEYMTATSKKEAEDIIFDQHPDAENISSVQITKKDNTKLVEHVVNWRGRPENPMTTKEMEKKCRDLLAPVLGEDRSQKLIDKIWNLERVSNMRELRPLLSSSHTST